MPDQSGRVAVVTGASSGIGEHVARALAAGGAQVALLARRADRLSGVVEEITSSGGRAAAYPVDVTDEAGLRAVAADVRRDLGAAGIVINNAGIMLPTPVTDIRESDWAKQVDLNIGGLNTTVQAFAGQLIATAAATGVADLVSTASIAGRTLFPGFSVYAATKAYVIQLGANLRAELGPKNVRVTTIEPGIVGTELQSHIDDEATRARLAGTRESIERLAPADIANVIAFAVGLPAHVNLAEVAVLPTRQPA
ncbi:SDR family oxidoreductase [Amycolatopsis sp. NBC_00345]|uniref:SDR family oxidoreductase n=1 Tax=Amycolatopsis sp. NBC_00345 TaxID=2975955 RepID=UPI002E267FB7